MVEEAGIGCSRFRSQLRSAAFLWPILNAYVWPKVRIPDRIFDLNTSGYRDALCAQIGKSVVAVVEEPKIRLAIQFTDGVSIEISLRDRTTREAAMLQADSGKKWNVW